MTQAPHDPHDQAFFEQMRGCRDNYRKLADCIHAVVGTQGSCLDIGCGIGLQTARLKELGWGIEGGEYTPVIFEMQEPGIEIHQFDLTASHTQGADLNGVRDCVICTETAEHIPEEYAMRIVDNIASRALNVIVWSAAAPGQEWEGHINLQHPDYWLTRFRIHGWTLDENRTAQLRGLMEMQHAQHWMGRQNFCVLVKTEKPIQFSIVSTVLNAEKWIEKHVQSVQGQTFIHYTHTIIDAKSEDYTTNIVEGLKETLPQLALIVNEQRLSALENCWSVWRDLPDDEIIVWLDGDDWLAHDRALEVLALAYASKSEPWLTYGQFMFSDGEVGFAMPYPPGVNVRYADWRATHLKTFRAGLVKKLTVPPVADFDGREIRLWPLCLLKPNHDEWVELAIDKAVMWPLLEMAGSHYTCVYQILSVYNMQASWAANRNAEARQVELDEVERLRKLPPFLPLTARPW